MRHRKLSYIVIAFCFLLWLTQCSAFKGEPQPDLSWQLPEYHDTVNISPDAKLLAVSVGKNESREIRGHKFSGKTSLELRNVFDGSLSSKLDAFATSSIAISPDNKLVATGTYYGDIFIWNLQTSELIWTTKVAKQNPQICLKVREVKPCQVSYLAFSPDSRYLASYTNNERANIWEVTNGKRLYHFDKRRTQFTPDGNFIAYTDSPIKLYSLESGEVAKQLKISGYPLFSLNKTLIATFEGKGNTITLYNRVEQTIKNRFLVDGYLQNWSFSPNGEYLAVASYIPSKGGGDFHVAAHSPSSTEPKNIIVLYRLSSEGKVVGQNKLLDVENGIRLSSADIAFSEDSQTFIFGGYRGNVYLWNLEDIKF